MKCMFCSKVSADAEDFATPTLCKSCQTSMSQGKPIDTTAHAHDEQTEESSVVPAVDEEVEDDGNPSGIDWYIEAVRQYAVFTGRARRKEYWWFFFFNLLFSTLLSIGSAKLTGTNWLGFIYGLAMFLPQAAVTVRRLHDIGLSGWWFAPVPVLFWSVIGYIAVLRVQPDSAKYLWLALIAFAPGLALLIAMARDGGPNANRYGPSPKYLPEESIEATEKG